MLTPQKESIFGCSCRLWLLSWRRARVFARSCSLLSKYLPISWKQRKEQSHAQCHVTHRIRIFDKISQHVKVAKSVDIAVPELAVTGPIQQVFQERNLKFAICKILKVTGKAKKYFSCFGNLIHMYPVSVTFRGQYCATSSKPKNVHICTRLSGGIYCFFSHNKS